jgi:thymidylate kinase
MRGPDHGDPASTDSADRDPDKGDSADRDPTSRDPAPILIGRVLWALSLAREKRQRLETAWRARNRGLIVITDRFPQAQIAGFNDGPLLRKRAENGGSLLRRAAAIEEKTYLLAKRQAPDLVVRLRISPEVAVARKPEMTESEVARRDAAIASMIWPEETRVIDVDGSQPLEDVLRQVLLAIWGEI